METDHVMDNLDFSEEEIKEQLALLGYQNIPKHRLLEFKRDLDDLIRHGRWENLAPRTQSVTSQPAPPAYIREKVNPFDGSGKGFILHAEKTNPHRKQLTTCEDRSCGWRWGCCDSYAHHSVAPKLQLPPSAWNRLQGAPDAENTLESLLSDSLSSSSERQLRRFIKRKVLRKHEGKSLICDESDYSEGSASTSLGLGSDRSTAFPMSNINTQWDGDSDGSKSSLSSSFWSDTEDGEEDEEMINSKPITDAEASLEPPELQIHGTFTGEVSDRESDDDDGEDDDDRRSSPAPSLRTSGYGTYRAEEQFETNSQGRLSETKESRCSLISSELDDLQDSPACPLEDNSLPADGPCSGKRGDGIGAESKDHLHIADGQQKLSVERCLEDGRERRSDVEAGDEPSADTDIRVMVGWMEDKRCEQGDGHLRHRTDAVSLLEEQTAELDLSTSAQDVEGEGEGGSPPQISESDDFSLSSVEPYIRVMTRSQSDGDVRPKPKSFIRPVMSQQNIKKTDPVAKYHQYKKIWGTFNLPGETDRNALHMEIKEKLAYQPPPPKPRRVLEPNSYVVPTEKKRLALRWEIRNYLANGLLPPRFHDQL